MPLRVRVHKSSTLAARPNQEEEEGDRQTKKRKKTTVAETLPVLVEEGEAPHAEDHLERQPPRAADVTQVPHAADSDLAIIEERAARALPGPGVAPRGTDGSLSGEYISFTPVRIKRKLVEALDEDPNDGANDEEAQSSTSSQQQASDEEAEGTSTSSELDRDDMLQEKLRQVRHKRPREDATEGKAHDKEDDENEEGEEEEGGGGGGHAHPTPQHQSRAHYYGAVADTYHSFGYAVHTLMNAKSAVTLRGPCAIVGIAGAVTAGGCFLERGCFILHDSSCYTTVMAVKRAHSATTRTMTMEEEEKISAMFGKIDWLWVARQIKDWKDRIGALPALILVLQNASELRPQGKLPAFFSRTFVPCIDSVLLGEGRALYHSGRTELRRCARGALTLGSPHLPDFSQTRFSRATAAACGWTWTLDSRSSPHRA